MRSRQSSRLAITPSSSSLAPKLKSKLDAIQGKYNEFMSNCATLFEEDSKSKPFKKISPTNILKKRESHNEFFIESEKLRRENNFLSKVVTDLSDKVINLESQQSESLVLKNFEYNLESKKKFLEKQEEEMVSLQKELEKTRVELNLIKKQHTESKALKCQTPVLRNSVTRCGLRLSKPKDFTPLNRNRSGSPISRSISPQERFNYHNKVKISELQSKLKQTIEERDLYKTWKDYCSKHPAVPPAITSIVSHYEIELSKASSMNSILKSKILTLESVLKETILDVDKILKVKRTKQVEDISNKLKEKFRENEIEKIKKIDFSRIDYSESDSEILRLSSTRYEKENKDLEDILRRESLIANLYSDAVKAKSEEVENLRNTFSTLYSSNKSGPNSACKPVESSSEVLAPAESPLGKNYSFELSFAPKQDSFKSHEIIFEEFLSSIETSFILKLNLLQGSLDKLTQFSYKLREKVHKINQERQNFEKIVEKNNFLVLQNEALAFQVQESEKKVEEIERSDDRCRKIAGIVRSLEIEKQEILDNDGLKERNRLLEEAQNLKKKCEDYEMGFGQAERKIKELQDQAEVMKNYRNEYFDMKEELESFKSKISILQDFHRESQKLVDDKNYEINDLVETIQEKNKIIEELTKNHSELVELKRKQEKFVLASNDYLLTIQLLTEESNKKSYEISKAHQESQESQLRCIELQKEVKKLLDIKESIEKELNKSVKSLQDSNISTNELVLKLNLKSAKCKEYKHKANKIQNQNLNESNEPKEIEHEANKIIGSLNEDLRNKDSEIKEIMKNFETLKVEKEKIERLLDDSYDIIQNLNKDLQDKLMIIEKCKNEKFELNAKLSNLEEKFQINLIEIEKDKQEKIELIENLNSFERKLNLKEKDLETEKKDKLELIEKSKTLAVDFCNKSNELEKEKSEKQELFEKLVALEKDFRIKIEELDKEKKEKLEISEKLINLDNELEKIIQENLTLKNEIDEEEKKIISMVEIEKNLSRKINNKSLKLQQRKVLIFELETKLKKVMDENEEYLVNSENQKQNNLNQNEKIEALNYLILSKDEEINEFKSQISTLENYKKIKQNLSDTIYHISINTNIPNAKINQHKNDSLIVLSQSFYEISIKPLPSPLKSYFLQEFEVPLTQSSISKLKETIQSLSKNQKLFESAYKRLESEFQSLKSSSQDKHDDLKIENYELKKLSDDLKKRLDIQSEEIRNLSSNLAQKDSKILQIQAEKSDLENSNSKLSLDISHKSSKILELFQEITNSSNYIQRILKEKESLEQEIQNLSRNYSLDHSQIRSELSTLRAQHTKLDSINSSLEQTKVSLEIKLKKLTSDKSELIEKQEEMIEEIEGLKQIRTQQSGTIIKLEETNKSLLDRVENDKKTINDYKNKLATYMKNTSALEKELRSMTPPPRRGLVEESKDESPSRTCHTADSLPQASIEKTLEKLRKLIKKPAPDVLVKFCKEILNQENFSLQIEGQSIISDDSKVSEFSGLGEVIGLEGNYRAHAKIIELQRKNQEIIENLLDKKNRVKRLKDHVKGLQEEFRRLDAEAKSQKNFDLGNFRLIFQKFLNSLKNVDSESMKILQVLAGILGLSVETLNRSDSKGRWNIFSKKNK